MCCHFWNRRTSSKRHRRVATGASWQKTTCCGEKSAGKRVSLKALERCQSRVSAEFTSFEENTICEEVRASSLQPATLSSHPGIDEPLPLKKRKIVKPGFTHSPWKSAYIRQHRIDTNWRRGDLKSPKVAFSSLQT